MLEYQFAKMNPFRGVKHIRHEEDMMGAAVARKPPFSFGSLFQKPVRVWLKIMV